jgi:crescentin
MSAQDLNSIVREAAVRALRSNGADTVEPAMMSPSASPGATHSETPIGLPTPETASAAMTLGDDHPRSPKNAHLATDAQPLLAVTEAAARAVGSNGRGTPEAAPTPPISSAGEPLGDAPIRLPEREGASVPTTPADDHARRPGDAHAAIGGQPDLAHVSLDFLGHIDELLRVRVNNVAARLNDLKYVHDDFDRLVGTLVPVASELPRLRAKSQQIHHLLAREDERRQELLDQLASVTNENAALTTDLAAARAAAEGQENALEQQRADTEAVRKRDTEREAALQSLEWQLTEADVLARRVGEANRLLTGAADAAERKLANAEADVIELMRKLDAAEGEHARVSARLADEAEQHRALRHVHGDLEKVAADLRRRLSEAEERITAERQGRGFSEAHLASERDTLAESLADASTKLEETTVRLETAEAAAASMRAQLAMKIDGLVSAQRTLKGAEIENETLKEGERAHKQELEAIRARVSELSAAAEESRATSDGLRAELKAKEHEAETANARAASLQTSVEQLSARLEQQRSRAEAESRSLFTQLENERSQRMLAQGALEASREALSQTQQEMRAAQLKQQGLVEDRAAREGATSATTPRRRSERSSKGDKPLERSEAV